MEFNDKKYLAYADTIAHAFNYDRDCLKKLYELAISLDKGMEYGMKKERNNG